MQNKRSIPDRLFPLLGTEIVERSELADLVSATGRFIQWLVEGDYEYDNVQDPDLQNLEALMDRYYQYIKWSRVPHNIGLLNPKVCHDIRDPSNPHMNEKTRAFGLHKIKEERTPDEKHRFISWLRKVA